MFLLWTSLCSRSELFKFFALVGMNFLGSSHELLCVVGLNFLSCPHKLLYVACLNFLFSYHGLLCVKFSTSSALEVWTCTWFEKLSIQSFSNKNDYCIYSVRKQPIVQLSHWSFIAPIVVQLFLMSEQPIVTTSQHFLSWGELRAQYFLRRTTKHPNAGPPS